MNPWRVASCHIIGACALLLAIGGVDAARAQAPQAAPPVAAQDGRQILVMLRLPPDHLRPGGGYGNEYGDQLTRGARQRTAQQLARKHGLELVGDGWPMPLLGIECYVMRPAPGQSVEAAMAELAQDPLVAWTEPMHTFQTGDGDDRMSELLIAARPPGKV